MDIHTFITLVKTMRHAQRRYEYLRSEELRKLKEEAEKKVDESLPLIDGTQMHIFGDEN